MRSCGSSKELNALKVMLCNFQGQVMKGNMASSGSGFQDALAWNPATCSEEAQATWKGHGQVFQPIIPAVASVDSQQSAQAAQPLLIQSPTHPAYLTLSGKKESDPHIPILPKLQICEQMCLGCFKLPSFMTAIVTRTSTKVHLAS